MNTDGLDPPGEQLELFPMPDVVETIVHRAEVYRAGVGRFRWVCACGQSGAWVTTSGRANAGKRAHIVAVYRRNELRG
jgi:hypothetical protein